MTNICKIWGLFHVSALSSWIIVCLAPCVTLIWYFICELGANKGQWWQAWGKSLPVCKTHAQVRFTEFSAKWGNSLYFFKALLEYSCLTMLCVSTVRQSESAIHVHMSPLFSISFPFMGFSCGSDCKEASCNAGDQSLIPGLGRSPWEWNGNHSSILAWRIPWIEEPDGLQSMGSQRVRQGWETHTHF